MGSPYAKAAAPAEVADAALNAIQDRDALARNSGALGVDTPRSRCWYYRKVCGLPATVDSRTGGIRVRSDSVAAVQMPSSIAQLVKIDLDRHQTMGPIISHPRVGVWVFLVRSDISDSVCAREASLWRGRIEIAGPGQLVALPSPADRGGLYRAWIRGPHMPFRPSGLVLVESIRTVLMALGSTEITTELPIVAPGGGIRRTGARHRAHGNIAPTAPYGVR